MCCGGNEGLPPYSYIIDILNSALIKPVMFVLSSPRPLDVLIM